MRARLKPHQCLCLWCGDLFKSGHSASYCLRSHAEKARRRRQDRRAWTYEGCDAPHAPAEKDRGLAIAQARTANGEMLTCKCGLYHIVAKGEGGRSPDLALPARAVRAPVSEEVT